jgi:hypothetical protein
MRRDTTLVGLDSPILGRKRTGLINGLKLAMAGEEIHLAVDERIVFYRLTLDRLRAGAGSRCNESDQTLAVENRIRTLEMIRDHVWVGYTYLLGRKDLELAELLRDVGDDELRPSPSRERLGSRSAD